MGDMPTVVFGRVIREHSVPGMQYYFSDGRVKYKDNKSVGFSYTEPCINKYDEIVPCIFTVPEDLDFSRMNDVEYVKQYSRSAVNLNANTMSPVFVIRDGEIICVKKDINQYVRIRYYKNWKSKRRRGNRYITTCKRYFEPGSNYHSREITVFPVGLRHPSSLSIYSYNFTQKFKARGTVNIHAHTYDGDDNVCYFRASKIGASPEIWIEPWFTFRCSEFENLGEGWQYSFDFNGHLNYGDILSFNSKYLPKKVGEKYVFNNTRTGNDIAVFIDSISGNNHNAKTWIYYPS